MDSLDFFASFFTVIGVVCGLFAWFVGPLALTMILVYIYNGNVLLGIFLGVIVELIAIIVGFRFVDVF